MTKPALSLERRIAIEKHRLYHDLHYLLRKIAWNGGEPTPKQVERIAELRKQISELKRGIIPEKWRYDL